MPAVCHLPATVEVTVTTSEDPEPDVAAVTPPLTAVKALMAEAIAVQIADCVALPPLV